MNRLIKIDKTSDILPAYRQTPIALLLEYHNLNKPFDDYNDAQLLVGMCMDNRNHLNIPDNFSFIIRSGGSNLKYSEFKVSYAISIGGIKHIALIGHNNCGMSNLKARKDEFIKGMINNAGWSKQKATSHFVKYEVKFEIGNEIDFILSETKRLRLKYPKICIAPMLYKVEDRRLYLINEN